MKLIIDIPDKDRRDIYWTNGKRVANLIGEYKVLAVLPEGHGDLISRSELKKAIENYLEKRQDVIIWETDMLNMLDNAPTIIEADKENKE